MKAFIIVFCVVVANVQAADIIQELVGQAITECRNQVQAKPEDMMQLLQRQPTVTAPAKCLVACLAKRFRIMNAEGELNLQTIKEMMKMTQYLGDGIYKKLSAIVDTCSGQVHVGDNECEIAYSYYSCALNEAYASNLPSILLGVLL